MKKIITKADIRAHLERETEHFLDAGGQVEKIPRGLSGRDARESMMLPSRSLFIEPSIARTPIPEVIAAIEARRKALIKRTQAPKRSRLPRRRRKMLYDDFGEPLRRIWIDD